MSLQGWAQKYASNRKQELQLKKELEAVKNKALLEHYAKQRGVSTPLPPVSPPGKGTTQPRSHAHAPKPPSQAQPKSLPAAIKTRRVHPISSQQPTVPGAFRASDTVEPSSKDQVSARPVKSPSKPLSTQKHKLQAGQKQPASQKVTLDTSQKVKFAIVNSQNTSLQMNFSKRQPGRVIGREASSFAPTGKKDGLKNSRFRQERQVDVPSTEESESRPFSHPTATDSHLSASSYQRYVMSQTTDYRNADSNLTTKAANTPAPVIIEQGISVSVSGMGDSFQPSRVDFSSKSYESFPDSQTSEGSEIHSQSVSQLGGQTDNDTGSYSRLDSSGYSMTEDSAQGEMVSKPQSGRVTIEVDMRFPSMDRPGSELSQLSSSLAGGDGLSMSAVSEQSRTASSQDGGSQLHTLPHEAGNEIGDIVGTVENDRGSQLESISALSVGTSEVRSSYQESEGGEGGHFREEGEVLDMVELQASGLERQHQDEYDSQPYSGSVSKRSSISYQSEAESQPRSEHSSIHEHLNVEQQSFDKVPETVASLEHLDEVAPAINTADKPEDISISDIKLSDNFTTRLQASENFDPQNHVSKSSSTLHASSSDLKLSSPYSRSLSSIGMPYSLLSQAAATTTMSTSSQQQHSTPSQSVATSQMQSQRSSFGSVQSSVHSIKPSATHMIEGLQHLSTSESRADTSSWLLAHHSISKMGRGHPSDEEKDEDPVDSAEVEESFSNASRDGVKSEVDFGDSHSLLSEKLLHESQSQLQTSGSRKSSSIRLTKLVDNVQEIEPLETPTNIHVDKGGVSLPTLHVEPPPDVKTVMSSESQEHIALSEKAYTMADILETRIEMVDDEEEEKSEDSTSLNLAEYLAFSTEPVTLEDIMHISGQALPIPNQAESHPKSPRKQEKLPKSDKTKVRFLSTWESSKPGPQSTHHHSIHHFCMEPSLPQLPIHLQVASRQTHAKPLEGEDLVPDKTVDEATDKSEEIQEKSRDLSSAKICPPPNTPYTATHATSMSTARGKAPVISQDNEKATKPSERPHTVSRSSRVSGDDDDIIERAKSELRKEQRGEVKPSSAKLREKRVKKKAILLVHNVSEGESIMLGGSRMKVAQNPANLLWVPAPPKLSLHPSTVQNHLFPDYHSSSTSAKPADTLHLWTTPSWQLAAMGRGVGRTKEQGDSTDGYTKKLLPLAFSSIKDMSLLKNLTIPLPDTATTSTKTDSLQPSTNGSLVSELRTPTSPTDSTLSGSEKQSVGSSQQEATVPQISDARKAALARRRHTVFITHDTIAKGTMQQEQQDEESDEFQSIETKAKKANDSVRQTQSLPLIVDSADTAIESCSDNLKDQDAPAISGRSVGKHEEFERIMEEVKSQREQLLAFYNRQREEELLAQEIEQAKREGSTAEEDDNTTEELQPMEGSMLATSGAFTSRKLQRATMRAGRRAGGGTGGGARNTTGRIRALRRTRSAQIRVQQARETLSQPPKILTRSTSFPLLKDELVHNTNQGPSNDYRRSKRKSLPSLLTETHFQSLKHYIDTTNPLAVQTSSLRMQSSNKTTSTTSRAVSTASETDSYQWALQLWWDVWFPEVLQEYKEIVAAYSTSKNLLTLNFGRGLQRGAACSLRTAKAKKDKAEKDKSTESVLESAPPQLVRLANIDPLPNLNSNQCQQIKTEIMNLTKSMSSCHDDSMRAVFLCRRGALLRKVGRLRDSLSDLRSSLSLQPSLSDALWHRHLLYLIQGDEKLALDDLNLLLKSNKKHYGGYRSRAGLVLRQGDTSKAVFNLTKAIALQSKDPEMYFMRAELYEKRGEIESALSDYARVNDLQPSNMEAISRQAMHKFKKRMWAASTQHFNALLQLDPNNTQARIHRARAQYNLGRYVEALQDVSAAIHLNPNGAQAFYHRACLLQTSQPQQALRDLSVSLLLDDSVANVSAYVHRGVLYTQMKCYNEALCDFEAAIKLQHSLPSPHICAGLIHMLHRGNLPRAMRCFTVAIGVDPTCTRAYLCRAEAYKRSEMYDHAILDCTRVIHLEPNNPIYYLRKGELYLALKNFAMAALHIRTAAKLCYSGFNQSKTQQALVESFLGNHTEAVALLRTLLRSPAVFSLMGKIQYKAKLYDDAVGSFRQAITLVERALQPKYMVAHMSELDMTSSAVTRKVRGDIHYQCGRSLVEGGAIEDAIDEFSEMIKHCPHNATGYYERGVAKLKAGSSKGIHDLNKSLAIDPKLFQAFLARAAHYGRTGRHSKAILNCNEAIRLVPNSVRAYVYRGALKYHVELYSGAIDDLNTAISLDPTHAALAFFNRALCHQATRRLQQALSDYSTVLLLQESPEYSYKVYVNRGLLYLQLKDYANALLDFMEAKRSGNERGNPAIHQAIGYCHHQLGSLDAAIDAYSLAIVEDPSFLEAYVGRGNVYMDFLSEEGFTKSKADYLHVLELNSSYLPARVNLAFLLQAEGRFKQAWDELTCVLKEDSYFAPALEARAVISLQMGNTFGALLDINNALKVVQSAALLTNRGVIHQFIGDLVNAMRDYQKAVSVQSDYSLAHFNIGNVLFQQRHFKQAITSYTRALSSCQDDSILVNRAIAHSILHDTEQALVDFDLAIELNPHSAPSYFNRGNLHYSLGNYSSAEQDYKKALELQPTDWLTMYYYGEVLGRQRRAEETKDMFRLAAKTEIP